MTFEALVQALVCDLTYRSLLPGAPDGGAAINLSLDSNVLRRAPSRYDAPWQCSTLPAVLNTMTDVGLALKEPGGWGGTEGQGYRTEIRPGPALLSQIGLLTTADFDISPAQEIVLLGAEEKVEVDGAFGPSVLVDLIDYVDDALTHRLRGEMRAINDWLAAADITLDPAIPGAERIDPYHRRLYRRFTRGSFQSGGRIWGGWWMNLKKAARPAILINGGRVASIDFSAMAPVTLYAMAGAEPPPGDIYCVGPLARWAVEADGSINPKGRAALKTFLSASMFHDSPEGRPMSQWPGSRKRRRGEEDKSLRSMFPPGTSLGDLRQSLHAAHPALVPHLYRGKGHTTQLIESNVLVATLLRLRDLGCTALPLHDAVLAPLSRAQEVREVMVEEFAKATGAAIEVEVKVYEPAGT